jgi:hypothetical protein
VVLWIERLAAGLSGLPLLLQPAEFGDGTEVTALVGGLEAEQAMESAGMGAAGFVCGAEELRGAGKGSRNQAEELVFGAGEAALFPIALDQGVDEEALDGACRKELFAILPHESFEAGWILAGDDEAAGVERVVSGRVALGGAPGSVTGGQAVRRW